jgi:ATP-binding cassette subfamily B protein
MPLAGQHQRDLLTVKNFISGATPTIMDVPWSLLFLAVIYMINPVLGFIGLLGIVILVVAALINEFATRKALLRASEKAVETTLAADIIGRQSEAIQAMGMGNTIVAHWEQEAQRGLALQDIAQQRSAIITGISRSLRMLLQMAVIGVGAYLALNHQLTAGGLVASSILIARAMAPFEGTIQLWKQMISARDAYHRLQVLLKYAAQAAPGTTTLPAPKGMLQVESLYVSIAKSPPILKGVSLRLDPGESLGIIGPSAAGKSTLAKAMVGIYQPQHGSVRLDGADLYSWAREDAGPHIGYLPQQVELFSGTIKQNIARMLPDAPDQQVIEAAQRAGVHQMVLQLPKAYDTYYTPGNAILSPGQKQRLGLARAIFGNPRLVVLDEPNSNLDGDGERALMITLAYLKQAGITTIVVAHRPSILANVDKVLMLKGGMVEVIGARDEVLQRFTASGQRRLQEAGGNA